MDHEPVSGCRDRGVPVAVDGRQVIAGVGVVGNGIVRNTRGASHKGSRIDKRPDFKYLRETVRLGTHQVTGHDQGVRIHRILKIDDLQIGHHGKVLTDDPVDLGFEGIGDRPEGPLRRNDAVGAAEDTGILEGPVLFGGNIVRIGVGDPTGLQQLDFRAGGFREETLPGYAVDYVSLEGGVRAGIVVHFGAGMHGQEYRSGHEAFYHFVHHTVSLRVSTLDCWDKDLDS